MDKPSLFLVGSLTSPYVRKLRLLLLTQKLSFEFQSINYLTPEDSAYLKSINPINKIPVLFLDKGKENQSVIYDSRVIYNYIAKTFGIAPLSIQEENILSHIDSLLDTTINLFSLKRGGLDIDDGKNAYIQRQWERIGLILNGLKPWIEAQDPNKNWKFLQISLYSFLDWASFRGIVSLSPYPFAEEFLKKFRNCEGVSETEIPKT